MEDKPTINFSFRITDEERRKLRSLAAANTNGDESAVLRYLIDKADDHPELVGLMRPLRRERTKA